MVMVSPAVEASSSKDPEDDDAILLNKCLQ
jgi:hypothetical protein